MATPPPSTEGEFLSMMSADMSHPYTYHGKLTVKNDLPQFTVNLKATLELSLKEIARDTLIRAREKTPKNKGALRADSYVKRLSQLSWRVGYNKDYSYRMETVEYKNYTTTGTGAHYLGDALEVSNDMVKVAIFKHTGRLT
ncbi:MAG: hypothetical protein WCJ60_01635 [bacterium]